jgi:hypothetical protein
VSEYVAASTPELNQWTVPQGWAQGRGAWGGLIIAALIRAAESEITEPDYRLRAVTSQLLGPVRPGAIALQSRVLRRGSATTSIRVDAVDESQEVLATLTGVWGADRVPDVEPQYAAWSAISAPDAMRWSEVPVVDIAPPIGPEFGSHLVFRPISGYPGQGVSRTLGWIGLPDCGADFHYDAATLVGLVDAWWPGALAVLSAMRPMGTISFSAHLMCRPSEIDGGEPLLHEGFVAAAQSGFCSEVRRLWSSTGVLVVDSVQSVAIIR